MDTLQLALDLFRRGNAHEAERACERRLADVGDDVGVLSLLSEIYVRSGRRERAADALQRIVNLHPEDAAVHRRLAGVLAELGRTGEAAAALHRSISIEPTSARAHNNLGQLLLQLGSTSEAIASFREALRLQPEYAIALNNLGLAHSASEEFENALECFRRALELNPAIMEAWVSRAAVLMKLNRFEGALDCIEAALRIMPKDVAVMTQKAFILLSLRRPLDCLDAADSVLRIHSQSAEALNARAGALRRLGRRTEALQSLKLALACDPAYIEAWSNYSTILHEVGDVEAATSACGKALELEPDGIQARTRLLARMIPPVPLSEDAINEARAKFDSELVNLESWLEGRILCERDAFTAAQQQFFYLSYQERSNRGLLERYRGASVARLAAFQKFSHEEPQRQALKIGLAAHRFKLGFISAHVYDHSVFNAILRGWLKCLDRTTFDITLFNLSSHHDATTPEASASVDHVEAERRPLGDWVHAIRRRNLDALIYPEIGMNETTLALSSLKLARQQFAAWGHPETSGLPSIDYYLSAELFEPPEAQDHYTERLVRLPNLGVYCQPYGVDSVPVDLAALGIDGHGPVFVCPGVPFKYRPQDDRIFIEIARRLQHCRFIFFHHEIPELSQRLLARLAAGFRNAKLDPARFLRAIPWQPRAAFHGLLRRADVYLDTIGFSGFNTMMQAIECHIPCVTYEGRFMRGRLGSGIIKRLGLPEWVATSTEQYIDFAAELGTSAAVRGKIREAMVRNEASAYADTTAVDALARVLMESRKS